MKMHHHRWPELKKSWRVAFPHIAFEIIDEIKSIGKFCLVRWRSGQQFSYAVMALMPHGWEPEWAPNKQITNDQWKRMRLATDGQVILAERKRKRARAEK